MAHNVLCAHFGGFLLLTTLLHGSLHRLYGRVPPWICRHWESLSISLLAILFIWIIFQIVQQVNSFLSSFLNLARLTGFEPATYGVEDHCSSNWASSALNLWLSVLDSNQRPPDYRSSALPTELTNNWKVGAGSENRTHLRWRGRLGTTLIPYPLNSASINYSKYQAKGFRA